MKSFSHEIIGAFFRILICYQIPITCQSPVYPLASCLLLSITLHLSDTRTTFVAYTHVSTHNNETTINTHPLSHNQHLRVSQVSGQRNAFIKVENLPEKHPANHRWDDREGRIQPGNPQAAGSRGLLVEHVYIPAPHSYLQQRITITTRRWHDKLGYNWLRLRVSLRNTKRNTEINTPTGYGECSRYFHSGQEVSRYEQQWRLCTRFGTFRFRVWVFGTAWGRHAEDFLKCFVINMETITFTLWEHRL